ncbi:hypothetical protein [Natrinema sp. DC36]|uniref:hypothetical protein n=1 Tax=Natrinema sp. DC36 TaxID=2878680 RepID=UPI001CF0C10B|nr:hypothetical protein [Natrinema sp. DC36]
MVQERTRDRVWKYSLARTIVNGESARPEKIAEIADVSERTARETLNVIAAAGWLKREVLDDGTVRFVSPDGVEVKDGILL